MTKRNVDGKTLAQFCAKEVAEKKADDILILEVKEFSSVADYFVLCTARSEPQMRALVNWIEKSVFEKFEKLKPLRVEGDSSSKWVLIDFADVLIHIMTPEMRDRYQLEALWGDAPRVEDIEKLTKLSEKK